ncbi:hypothetical protein SAMN05216593_103316 [Pseudomonas asturiensis]|uniref:Lipoprotein n=1 Tax=Pseudomonas asturiensis TaxID=1190415 RepID=A0A1M7LTN6_9PSED|nr:hypothetical protein [Pseudomonas asturiensis]SHM81535.1 hypothetical protein SAMN05216593_103316 [Pseudomonas asturiensis]
MKSWRVIFALSFLLLSGCLVTFKDPIPARDAAPPGLLGHWTSKNAWGEPLELDVSRAGVNSYKAVSYRKGDRRHGDDYTVTVARHGSRWYLSANLPDKYGAHYGLGGFELTVNGELVVYSLDMDRVGQWVEQNKLDGQSIESEAGKGILITSSLEQVFGYLDDPANSDVFLEVARYQRAVK